MEHEFNVLTEPWIPVQLKNGAIEELGILETLRRAIEISSLAESSPTKYLAIHRLLVAFLIRAGDFASGAFSASRMAWWNDGIPETAITDYVGQFESRFWLFDEKYPFMQLAALAMADETKDARKPWTVLASERASGATPTVFDKAIDDAPVPITYPEMLRTLLAAQQTTPGGLIQVFRTSDHAGPASNCATIIPQGESLLQTLLLNLPPWRDQQILDVPSWELEPPNLQQLRTGNKRLASGICERYTWLSRSVLLLRDETNSGSIQWIRYGAGTPIDDDPARPDPMIAHRIKDKNIYKIGFHGARAFWRDLSSLLPDPDGANNIPPPVIEWAYAMLDEAGEYSSPLHICAAGLSTDKAKCLRWRLEQFQIPRRIYESAESRTLFRNAIQSAEKFYFSVRNIVQSLALDLLPGSDSRIKRDESRVFADRLHFDGPYFAQLEQQLPALFELLDKGKHSDAMRVWSASIRKGINEAFEMVRTSLGRSPREIRAIAKAAWSVDALLDGVNKEFTDTTQQQGVSR